MLLQAIHLPKMIMGMYSGLSDTFGAGQSNVPMNILHQSQSKALGLFMSLKSGVHCISIAICSLGQETILL